jgi:hypothetical protein
VSVACCVGTREVLRTRNPSGLTRTGQTGIRSGTTRLIDLAGGASCGDVGNTGLLPESLPTDLHEPARPTVTGSRAASARRVLTEAATETTHEATLRS